MREIRFGRRGNNNAYQAEGAEFRVNTTVASQQQFPTVTMLADGGFVVVWRDLSSGTTEIVGQLYDSSGVPIGGEIAVSTSGEADPHVAALEDGGFLVTWGHYVAADDQYVCWPAASTQRALRRPMSSWSTKRRPPPRKMKQTLSHWTAAAWSLPG